MSKSIECLPYKQMNFLSNKKKRIETFLILIISIKELSFKEFNYDIRVGIKCITRKYV